MSGGPVRDEIFAIADVLVLRGGHAVISQAIQFGKPIVTIPIDNHGEQTRQFRKSSKNWNWYNVEIKSIE